jgi:hypothetical protein
MNPALLAALGGGRNRGTTYTESLQSRLEDLTR